MDNIKFRKPMNIEQIIVHMHKESRRDDLSIERGSPNPTNRAPEERFVKRVGTLITFFTSRSSGALNYLGNVVLLQISRG
jgi:hypothetical protein